MLGNRSSRQLLLIAAAAVLLLTSFAALSAKTEHIKAVSDYVADRVAKQHAQWYPDETPGIPCDPNKEPGYPHPAGYWATSNPECPGDDYGKALRDTPRNELWDKFPELRNKTLLLAGDSVGRHLFEQLCGHYVQGKLEGAFPEGYNWHYSGSYVCEQPELGFKLIHVHIFGMVNTTNPDNFDLIEKSWGNGGRDWDLQTRVDRWFNTTLAGIKPDYVHLNSGAWEFRYWFVRDIYAGKKYHDMPLEDLQDAARWTIESLQYFQNKWPTAKVWYMHMSMMNEDDIIIKKAHGGGHLAVVTGDKTKVDDPNAYPPLYTWRRQSQYHSVMRHMIQEAGWNALDYTTIQAYMSRNEFSKVDDVIHPQNPAKAVMASMIMNKVRRHEQYGV